jgi:hypothetical protein
MVTARSIVAALALMPASALAQNSYSFTNAGESMVRYSVASTQAAMSCASDWCPRPRVCPSTAASPA